MSRVETNTAETSLPLVIGMTGASGAPYAVRLLEVLLRGGYDVHLMISPSGQAVLAQELGLQVNTNKFALSQLLPQLPEAEIAGKLTYHHHHDYFTPVASGSFLTGGMVVCPCSGSTLSGIAHGSSTNLIQRAADVHLKERRRLILVPRETPLSLIHLDNLRTAAAAGATILPASPGWYHGVHGLNDLIDFIVARILDQLGLPNRLMKRWGEGSKG
jgi:4-hydroxy-3-polyprenylbenzoate decarboxylase